MKNYKCDLCPEPCFLTIAFSDFDPEYCPFSHNAKASWEKYEDEADDFVGYGEIPQKAR